MTRDRSSQSPNPRKIRHKAVLFGAGASYGARPELRPPLGKYLHEYVARYLEKAWGELEEWDSFDGNTASKPIRYASRDRLKRLLKNTQSFESLVNRLSQSNEGDLLAKLNFLMACALTPPVFPVIPNDDPKVDDAFIERRDIYDVFLEKNCTVTNGQSDTSFITLNYDCLLERAICRVFYDGRLIDGETQSLCRHVDYCIGGEEAQSVEVLKPHGSINWLGNLLGSDNEDGTIPITVRFERQGRPTYREIDVVSSPYGRDPEALIIAHYAPRKNPQANPDLLVTLQERAKSRICAATYVEIIGIHLPTDPVDDPFLWDVLEGMRRREGKVDVIYVNPNPDELKRANDYYNFQTVEMGFEDYATK